MSIIFRVRGKLLFNHKQMARYSFFVITLVATSFAFPMQTLHFNAEELPVLNPPISWDVKLSPETKLIVPVKDFLSPLMMNWYPPSYKNKYISFTKMAVTG